MSSKATTRSSSSKGNSKTSPAAKNDLANKYLIFYNVASGLAWAYVLIFALIHITNIDGRAAQVASSGPVTASSYVGKLLSSSASFLRSASSATKAHSRWWLPGFLQAPVARMATVYGRVGPQVALVQSFAVLEVAHVALGLVRSSLPTTAMQVTSRLLLVWAVVEQSATARANPAFASMIIAWSFSEIIRYSFYTFNLLGLQPPQWLVLVRYSAFYVLYPIGAGSEWFLTWISLPNSSPVPGFRSWYQGAWGFLDYLRGIMVLVWAPALYVLFTYMMGQRRKVLGGGRKLKDN
ncbi:tyrosine phosphatase-like protein [Schizophyllum commune]